VTGFAKGSTNLALSDSAGVAIFTGAVFSPPIEKSRKGMKSDSLF
jgi:hypothetical protein